MQDLNMAARGESVEHEQCSCNRCLVDRDRFSFLTCSLVARVPMAWYCWNPRNSLSLSISSCLSLRSANVERMVILADVLRAIKSY